jgi:DHA1 family inner membrane transport protein
MLGTAIAAVIGAGLLDGGYGYRSLPVLGAVALALAWLVAIVSLLQETSRGVLPPSDADRIMPPSTDALPGDISRAL